MLSSCRIRESRIVTTFTFFTHLSLLSLYYCKSNKVTPSHGLHPGYRAISNLTDLDMVETRNQEKTMLWLRKSVPVKNARQTSSAPGKQPFNDAGGSQMMDPTSAESNRPPEPPDLHRFQQYTPGNHSTPPTNTLTNRLTKLTFPAFDGKEFREWICRCEQFFDIDNTAPELKVRLAAMHMTRKALQWHINYLAEQFRIFPSWTDYNIALSSRFNGLFDDPMADLVALKQGTDSVEEYLEKFKNRRTRFSLPEAHALSIFLTNMNPHLSLHVREFNPTSMSAAARIASLHESSLAATPQRSYRAPFNPSQQQKSYGVISVNALSGSTTFNCMRVIGKYGKRKLYILVDPGSTHNFLDIKVAQELGCTLDAFSPMGLRQHTNVAATSDSHVTDSGNRIL
ncbi:hypothetical protein F2Q68_00041814 [Brassica cretica]|uniref:Retrotransposon gag domain-containing protein n=1 Tax=Brassica cretica TaxID=69181 RepID=A0A8S9MB63_BRACR|nr:hypothetical protein F2Q68_00041814 [Brassica cretica]